MSYGANGDPDQSSVNQTFAPALQSVYDTNLQGQQGLANIGRDSVNRVGGILGQNFDFSGAPQIDPVDMAGIPNIDIANYQGLPQVGSADATRAKVRDAMLSRVNTDISRDRDSAASTLTARGIPRGSEAWNREMEGFDRQQTDARYQAELSSGQAAQQQFSQDLARRQQGISEEDSLQRATIAYRQQGMSEQQAQQAASLDLRRQAITELLAGRQTPLNEISALRSGSQVAPLSFQPYTGVNAGAAPVFGAAQSQYGANADAFNAQAQGQNNTMSGLFSLGAAALPLMFSDRRLKSNIRRIGMHSAGVPLYAFDIFGSREIGVMADEVLTVRPHAVHIHSSGFLMVDYGALHG